MLFNGAYDEHLIPKLHPYNHGKKKKRRVILSKFLFLQGKKKKKTLNFQKTTAAGDLTKFIP